MPDPDPAATVLALRRAEAGFEVLVVQRNSKGFFGNLAVFPGGKVEDIDVPDGMALHDDRSHRNAAVREFAEETGILLTGQGPMLAPDERGDAFYEWLAVQPFTSAADRLVLVSRWVTPDYAPRRFDTRFYVIDCTGSPEVSIDPSELVGHCWVTAESALEKVQAGTWSMFRPTIAHLEWLQGHSSVEDAVGSAVGADRRTLETPGVVSDGSIVPIQLPQGEP